MLPVIGTDAESIYITGDTHFDHSNMIKFLHRPFLGPADVEVLAALGGKWHNGSWKGPKEVKHKISPVSVEIMNEALIGEINRTVPKDAKLIHVGDWSINPKDPKDYAYYAERCARFRQKINCGWVGILWGNHDIPDQIHHLFQWSGFIAKVELQKLETCLVLSHYYQAVWDMSHRGGLHVYGHSHSEIEHYAELAMPGRRAMDVGVDNAAKILGQYRPFKLQEVINLLKEKPGFNFNPNVPSFYKGPTEHQSS